MCGRKWGRCVKVDGLGYRVIEFKREKTRKTPLLSSLSLLVLQSHIRSGNGWQTHAHRDAFTLMYHNYEVSIRIRAEVHSLRNIYCNWGMYMFVLFSATNNDEHRSRLDILGMFFAQIWISKMSLHYFIRQHIHTYTLLASWRHNTSNWVQGLRWHKTPPGGRHIESSAM